jgi:pyridoxal phosphate enzyme (YggS family)
MTADPVASRLAEVQGRIRAAERRFGRPEGSVTLLAVSKVQPASAIRAAFAVGQPAFGESYVQESLGKMAELADLPCEWHFIGRIQGNKTRPIAERFAWVHSLCDLHHARRLADQRPAYLPALQACIQVNTSGEASKEGLAPTEVARFLTECGDLDRIRIRGLMTLPAPSSDEGEQRRPLRALRELRDRLASPTQPLEVLSMGMSDDLEAAVAEGATLVRIGTAVFGPRPV